MRILHSPRRAALLVGLSLASLASLAWSADQVPHLLQHQGRIAVDGVNFNGSGQFKFAFVDAGTNVAAPAAGTVTVTSGFITSATVTASGMAYTTPPAITVNSPTGSGAVLQAVVTAGAVTAINVINAGSGYHPLLTTITIDPPPPSWMYQTYWRNADDAPPMDGEPDAAVTLTVTNGLYEVLLGDTGLTNMASIPAMVFSNPDVRLRVWFSDGTHGFQMLSPDKRIAAVGYTLMAETVQDGAITQPKIAAGAVGNTQLGASAVGTTNIAPQAVTSTKIANGTIGSTQIASGGIAGSNIASGAIGNSQLAANAVASGNIATGAVTTGKIGTDAVGTGNIVDGAVSSSKIAANAIGSGLILDGSVTSADIADSTVSTADMADTAITTAKITDSAVTTAKLANSAVDNAKLANNAVQWVHIQDGAVISQKLGNLAVTSEKLGSNAVTTDKIAPGTITSADIAAGAVGSTQIAAGAVSPSQLAKPPRTGTISSASLGLQFNQVPFSGTFTTACSTTPIVTLAARAGSDSLWNAFTRLTSVSTTGFSGVLSVPVDPITLDSSGDVGQYDCMFIVNSNPAVAYYDFTNGDLMFVRATNSEGSDWGTPVTVDNAAGLYPSLFVVNGYPAIAYYDGTNGNLKYVRASNANGTAWGTPVTVDSTNDVGKYPSLLVANSNPAIAYRNETYGYLQYVRATDASGTAWGTPMIVDSDSSVGYYTSMAIVNSYPAIAYGNYSGSSYPRYIRATNTSGTAWGTPATLTDSVYSELFPGKICLAVVNGYPAVAMGDSTIGAALYLRASNSNGTSWPTAWTVIDANGQGDISLALVGTPARPAVSYFDGSSLCYVRADDASGTTWGTPARVTSASGSGFATNWLVVASGQPAIAYYYPGAADLKFVRAPTLPSSYSIDWIAIEP